MHETSIDIINEETEEYGLEFYTNIKDALMELYLLYLFTKEITLYHEII